ncbi:hypothetical protein PanWU01x14_064470, partial [Parasponia andersonii]
MTIIQRLLWLCIDKKAFFYALIYHNPSQERHSLSPHLFSPLSLSLSLSLSPSRLSSFCSFAEVCAFKSKATCTIFSLSPAKKTQAKQKLRKKKIIHNNSVLVSNKSTTYCSIALHSLKYLTL